MGIKFGEPFPDQSTIPDCPKYLGSIDFQIVNSLPGLCFDGYGRKSYGSLWNIPALGFPYSVDVMIDDGKPVTFIINTNPKWFPELAKVLSQRYGKPMSDTTGSVQSGTGAQFDNRTLRWVGQRVTITADMRSGQVDTSKTYISDKAYWDARERANEKAASDGASKL